MRPLPVFRTANQRIEREADSLWSGAETNLAEGAPPLLPFVGQKFDGQGDEVNLWVWQDFRIKAPDDWEMLQFSRDPKIGRCAFSDRYERRLEFCWRKAAGEPDFERMMSDYVSKLRTDSDTKELEFLTQTGKTGPGQWKGFACVHNGKTTSRYGRYFRDRLTLIETVFVWPNGIDADLEKRVLASVKDERRRADSLERWRAFGMDLLVSPNLELEACQVKPAFAGMRFTDAKGRIAEDFSRRGMVSDWMRGSVVEWLRVEKCADVAAASQKNLEVKGHKLATISGMARSRGRVSLSGRSRSCEAAAWICPQDHRLYCVSRLGPRGDERASPDFPGKRLSCCDRLGRGR